MFQKAINKFKSKPKRLFLLDGLGALLSAFLLGVVLVHFESSFGIPKHALYILAIIPLFFIMYDVLCYFLAKERVGTFLRIIACLNLGYCFLSLLLAFSHIEQIKVLGWAYLTIEIIIVLFIAQLEWKSTFKL